MADRIRRVLVTRASTPLGRALVERLRGAPDVEQVCAVESRPLSPSQREPGLDVVPLVPDHRPFVESLAQEAIDTVIQCGLTQDRCGLRRDDGEADVISTMSLGAVIAQPDSPVRSWIVASSTDVYPISSYAPLVQSEKTPIVNPPATPGASIEEAEEYARDVAIRSPHLNVAILRLQHLVGPGVRGALARLLSQRPVPSPIGYDPTIQLLHLEDAADALAFAARHELAGLYNVASAGLIHWRDAVRAAGSDPLPMLPVAFAPLEGLAARAGLPHLPAELMGLLRYGHAADTNRIERAGWRSRWDQRSILAELGTTLADR